MFAWHSLNTCYYLESEVITFFETVNVGNKDNYK